MVQPGQQSDFTTSQLSPLWTLLSQGNTVHVCKGAEVPMIKCGWMKQAKPLQTVGSGTMS